MEFLETCEPELAIEELGKMLRTNPKDAVALEALANAHILMMHIEPAIQCLQKAISIQPAYTQYLTLSQLMTGLSAVNCLESGLKLILSAQTPDVKAASSTLCALAEIYLTGNFKTFISIAVDLCQEADAQELCSNFVKSAHHTDPTNPEVYSTMASFSLSINEPDDAKEYIAKSMDLMGDLLQISMPSKIALTKLLMETEHYDRALVVLENLHKEDDEDPEVWYLYGWCYYLFGSSSTDPDHKNDNWDDARDCLAHVLQLAAKYSVAENMLEHTRQLYSEIDTHLVSHGMEYDESVAAKDWEGSSSDDEDEMMD